MAAGEERSRKRRKVEPASSAPSAPSVSFSSSDQLHGLLDFSQSAPSEVKTAIDKFTSFLSSITTDEEPKHRAQQLKVLKKYCDEQSAEADDQVDFPNLLAVWSSAVHANDESVASAVPLALTRFFEATSSDLDFREFGLSLGHSLLKRDQLRLFDRCLSAPRSKESLTTSCLRLLTQIIGFDGGTLASSVFGRRDLLYRRLDWLLSQPPPPDSTASQETSTTAYGAALDFLLANLKYLDPTSKSELITHGRTLYSAIRSLAGESADIVVEFLNTLSKTVLGDGGLSQQLKARCFNSGVISTLATLYDYGTAEAEDGGDDRSKVRDALHRLLLQACTTADKGILLPQSGWYPAGMNPEAVEHDANLIDLGLDSPYYFDDYTEKIPVKNSSLSTFIQSLHPEKDILQATLITSIFTAAPELVADYFSKKRKMLVPPTADDPVWRGQFAFLFSVVQLSPPRNCGWQHGRLPPSTPPPLSVVIENILPRPLERATVSKCLHMNQEDIMVISAARLVTVALEKLDVVLKLFSRAHAAVEDNIRVVWGQASRKIVDLFVERIPPLQDIVTALQSLAEDNDQVRTTVLECLATYHSILPAATAGSKFDIGPTLRRTLQRLDSEELDSNVSDVLNDQSTHLVRVAHVSSATKWFQKSAADTVSLVVQLLTYCVKWSENSSLTTQVLPIIRGVLVGKGILSDRTQSLEALLLSLTPTKKWQPDLVAYEFLDNCITRTMQRPVSYLDKLEQTQDLVSDSRPLSLLVCCVAQQWAFVTKKAADADKKKSAKNVAEWIAKLFSALEAAGENFRVMSALVEEMSTQSEEGDDKVRRGALTKAFEKRLKKPIASSDLESLATMQAQARDDDEHVNGQPSQPPGSRDSPDRPLDLSSVIPPLPRIPTSLKGLDRWGSDKQSPDFESEMVASGRLASLMRCLISPDSEVRLKAFHTLQALPHLVEQSTYTEKTQLYLLLGEVCETVRLHTLSDDTNGPSIPPVPSIVAELAVSMLPVLADPASPLYQKTNRFLLRSPGWSVARLLPYWLSTTLLAEPEADDTDVGSRGANAQALEVDRLLDLLAVSLRTTVDVDLFRRAHVFTRLFSHYLSPACPKSARRKILRVVHHATRIPTGSDTLVTRAGAREWLSVAARVRDHGGHGPAAAGKVDRDLQGLVRAVAKQVDDTCSREGIARWERERRVYKTQVSNDTRTQKSGGDTGTNPGEDQGNRLDGEDEGGVDTGSEDDGDGDAEMVVD